MEKDGRDDSAVIVIGGGISGLSCAVALCDAGIPVRVFEGSETFGGRAQSVADATTGTTVDIGPHVLTSEHRNMLALMERLGTGDRVVWQREKFITLIDDGRAIAMRMYRFPAPLHFLPNFFRVPKLSVADIWSARRVLLHVIRMNETGVLHLDDVNAEKILRDMGVSEAFIDWFWRTVSMTIMNVPLERCSAGSLLRFLGMMAGRSDFQFGFPATPLAGLFVPQSLDVLAAAGSDVRRAAAVRTICIDGNAVTGVVLDDGARIRARCCVAAVPPAALSRLLPAGIAQQAGLPDLPAFQPSMYVSTYLWFSRKLTRERFWARIWSARNLNYDFYDLSNIRTDNIDGSLIASNIIFSERVAGCDDDALIDGTLRELAEYLPEATRKNLVHARVHRIAMAILAPRPGFERSRPATRTSVNGLFLAGDWIQTALPESMESAVRAGFLAAEAVAADRGRTLNLALPQRPMQGLAGWLRRKNNA